MKNYRRNNYIGKMKKGFKQKLSLLMIACLLFTGYRGLTISGRADSSHTEQNNEIEVSGTQVKVQLLGADLRRAATEAILKGEKVGKSNLRSYSKDQELATEFEEYFNGEKEIYNIPLNSIAENLEESLNAEEAGLQIYVERDAKDLDRLVRKESKESLLLYSKESAVAGLLPKKEEATTVSLTEEEKASDSNLERNTELTGSELITFVYENKSTERMTFQLSVDGNKYPKVTVASKTSLFKQFLGDAKKAQAEAKNAKATEAKVESTEAQTVEASKAEESSAEAKQEVAESKATEATKATEESKASEEARKDDSEVAIVSTAAEAVAESTEAKAEVKTEASEEATEARVEATEAEVKEKAAKAEKAQAEKATEAQKAVVEDSSLLKDITEHSEEILPELQSIRFTQYSLNELGRKSQNVEIEGFGNVQVFYDEAAFDGDVVLEAKRLFKPEEEVEGEKLSEEQVKVLKEHSIYDDAASLDIRFVDKKDSATEVEPKSPVSVRISIDKKALPETVSSDSISIHHLVENDETKVIEKVDTVVHSSSTKNIVNEDDIADNEKSEIELENSTNTLKRSEIDNDSIKEDTITKEFTVNSFSLYQIHWDDRVMRNCPPIRFHYVDKNFNEIGPTVTVDKSLPLDISLVQAETSTQGRGRNKKYIYKHTDGNWYEYTDELQTWYSKPKTPQHVFYDKASKSGEAFKKFLGYDFVEVYPYKPGADNLDKIVNGTQDDYFDINYKYSPSDSWKPDEPKKEFGKGLDRIDSAGYYSPQFPGILSPWYSKDLNQTEYCYAQSYDFYFVYDINPKEAEKRTEEEIETRQDKYIKDNQNGTYDLTLSAQVKKNSKPENLDIVFLVDTTKTMDASFDTKNEKNRSRREAVQDYLSEMVTSLSKNSNYNLRFGLVGFGGGKTDDGTTISDTAFNDVTYIGGFTDSASDFKTMLAKLPKSEGNQTGPNYTAAIMGARRLLDGSFGPTANGKPSNFAGGIDRNVSDIARENANKIIVLITDNDPVYSYVLEDGVYDETRKTSGELKSFKATLQKGYSYGNGVDFSRVALNQARGFLSNFSKPYTAFYTIGIGNKDNWKHLKELSEAHGYDQRDDWRRIKYDNGELKFIRAKSAVQKNADIKNFDGSTPELLKSSIVELGKKIAPNATELTITDTLSENVTLVNDKELKAEVFKMKANGVDTDGEALTEAQLKELGLNRFILEKPNPALQQGGEIKLTTDPSDFSLPAGYEIRLTATIKPSATAYEKLRKGEASKNTGGDRTDLQDIYRKEEINLPSDYSDDAVYGTSAGKKGLFTNDGALFKYKWKGKTPEIPYNNPIIKVQNRDLTIEKQIVGLNGEGYKVIENNKSKSGGIPEQKITELGKAILRNIKITVYEVQDDGTDKDYVSFKLYRDESLEDQGKESEFTVGNVTVKRHQVVYNQPNDRLSFSYTITGLNPNKKYKVVENVPDKSYGYTTQEHLYKLIEKENNTNEKAFDLTEHSQVVIVNKYGTPKQKVTIQKFVDSIVPGYLSQADNDRYFDFYLRVYHPDTYDNAQNSQKGAMYTYKELETLKDNFPKEVRDQMIDITQVPPNSGNYALHFKLKNGDKLEIPLDENLKYSFSEAKVTGFLAPNIDKQEINKTGTEYCELVPDNGNAFWFTCERLSVNKYIYVKFTNHSTNIPIPTGIVRDITPYLFGIFGFVAMAGAYFAINKKRREA